MAGMLAWVVVISELFGTIAALLYCLCVDLTFGFLNVVLWRAAFRLRSAYVWPFETIAIYRLHRMHTTV